MMPPLPSPPMTAPVSLMAFTIDFTHCARRVLPSTCFGHLAAHAWELMLLTVLPGFAQDVIAHATKVYSSPNQLPSFSTKANRSTSGSTLMPRSHLLHHGLAEVLSNAREAARGCGQMTLIAVDFHHFAPESFQQHWHNDSTT